MADFALYGTTAGCRNGRAVYNSSPPPLKTNNFHLADRTCIDRLALGTYDTSMYIHKYVKIISQNCQGQR